PTGNHLGDLLLDFLDHVSLLRFRGVFVLLAGESAVLVGVPQVRAAPVASLDPPAPTPALVPPDNEQEDGEEHGGDNNDLTHHNISLIFGSIRSFRGMGNAFAICRARSSGAQPRASHLLT